VRRCISIDHTLAGADPELLHCRKPTVENPSDICLPRGERAAANFSSPSQSAEAGSSIIEKY
jgi:hypothetical protein